MKRFCCLFAALILLAGCASAADRAQRKSPDFRAGYTDGCDSAGNRGANPRASSLVRDDAAFAGNKAYHAGWSTGFNACRGAGSNPGGGGPNSGGPNAGSRGPIADPNPHPF